MKNDKMKKLNYILIAGLIGLSLGFTSCGKKQKTTVIGYRTGSLCAIPMHIAVLNGLFEQEFEAIGQKVETLHQTGFSGTTAELVGAGKVHGGFELIASNLQAMENGLPIVFATGVHTGCTRYFVRPDSGIDSVADLKGKRAGVLNLTDSSVINLKRKLGDFGIKVSLSDSEVEFIQYDMSAMGIALQDNQVDLIALHEPMATKVQKEFGFKQIMDTGTDEKFKDEYCCQIFVTEDFLKDNPEGVKAFVRAIQKASAFVQAVPEEAARIQLENNFTTGTVEGNVEILKTLNYTSSYEKGKETFVNAVHELKELGILKPSTDVEAFIKRGYVDLQGIPEGYIYNKETKAFHEISKGSGDCCSGN